MNLLDADQEVPSAEDVWHMKYRFYYEEHSIIHAKKYRKWRHFCSGERTLTLLLNSTP